ncbi:hypothetical protein [Candidatus Vidania fulgoroideorum]
MKLSCIIIKKIGKKIELFCKKTRRNIYINIKEFKKLNIKIKKNNNISVFLNKKKILITKENLIKKDYRKLKKIYSKKNRILGYVKKKVKGGLEVLYKNIKCFLPNAFISEKRFRNINDFLKKKYVFKIVKIEKKNILLSKKIKKKKEIIRNLSFKIIKEYGVMIKFKSFKGVMLFNKKNKEILLNYLKDKKIIPVTIKKLNKRKKSFSFKINFLDIIKKKTCFSFCKKKKKNFIFYYINNKCYLFFKNVSWINYFKYFKKKENKKIVILNFLIKKKRIIIFLKQCVNNPWKDFINNYKINSFIKVLFYKRIKNFLVFKTYFNIYLYSNYKQKLKKKFLIKYINYKKKIIFISNI